MLREYKPPISYLAKLKKDHMDEKFGEPKPTRMSIQLVDRSIKYPKGIIEDVLIEVDKFLFFVYFMILDMDKDVELPLILGRPFLATARAVIDVGKGKLALKIGDEEVNLQIRDVMRVSSEQDDTCYSIDSIDHAVQHSLQKITYEDMLELCLVQGDRCQRIDEKRMLQLNDLDE
ncbi:protein kinase 2B, chloroplastic-like [Gossypium australe]|uniref:Protein kinase 2B, chloroplastic-like n=1 Tax=Gossypium australe TaxID=47621 RepID=A0A5B6UT42_9ROSI|nr:protein kinase 2B, chloroplastic-like [Gossypium australe]